MITIKPAKHTLPENAPIESQLEAMATFIIIGKESPSHPKDCYPCAHAAFSNCDFVDGQDLYAIPKDKLLKFLDSIIKL